jgi:hypothetical protein
MGNAPQAWQGCALLVTDKGVGGRGVLTQLKIRYASLLPPVRFHEEFMSISSNNKKPSKTSCFQGLDLVAGTGFEPVTFRL